MRFARLITWTLALVATGGCAHPLERTANSPQYKVETGGDCLELSDRKRAPQTALVDKIAEHIREQRFASAEALVSRRLDEVIEHLRDRSLKATPTDAEKLMARIVDAKLGHPEQRGWLAQINNHDTGIDRAEKAFEQIQLAARDDQWKRVKALATSNQSVVAAYPYHAVRVKLALAEAQRHLGEYEPASQAWQHAAIQTAKLAPNWAAPSLWEAIAAQRPASTPWPTDVRDGFAPLIPKTAMSLSSIAPEAVVWFAIGNARLQRSETSAALSAFQRSEAFDPTPAWRDGLHVYQAKSLLALEQTPAAVSLLTLVADQTSSPWNRSALALLGSGKFRDGQTEQARRFLKRSLDGQDTDFPDRAEALADYGLVFLTLGNASAGLDNLRTAQSIFESSGRIESLLASMKNEAAYHSFLGHDLEARAIHERIRSHELGNVASATTDRVRQSSRKS